MPVYDHRYRPWQGQRRGGRSAILTIARHAVSRIAASRLSLVLFALACVPPLGFGTFIYLSNNLQMLADLGMRAEIDLVDSSTFFVFLIVQSATGFLLAALLGPGLVAPDLAHGAMPLYLSRPIRRRDYVLGKFVVLAGMLSLITWVPGLLLVGLQAALAPAGWLAAHLRIPFALVTGAWIWIALVALMALAISAWVRWRPLATAMLFIVFVVGEAFGRVINAFLDTNWGKLVILDDLIDSVWLALFGVAGDASEMLTSEPLPLGAALTALGLVFALVIWMLAARVRAVEVAR